MLKNEIKRKMIEEWMFIKLFNIIELWEINLRKSVSVGIVIV